MIGLVSAQRQRVWRSFFQSSKWKWYTVKADPIGDIRKWKELIQAESTRPVKLIIPCIAALRLKRKPKRCPKALRGPRIHEVALRRTLARMTRRTAREALWRAGWKHDKDPWLRYL